MEQKNREEQKNLITNTAQDQRLTGVKDAIKLIMTAKAALVKALLNGDLLNVKNCFTKIGLTNCAREVSRMVEQPFGATISRTERNGKSRYGRTVVWIDYRLNRTDYNKEAIKKMQEYIKKHEN